MLSRFPHLALSVLLPVVLGACAGGSDRPTTATTTPPIEESIEESTAAATSTPETEAETATAALATPPTPGNETVASPAPPAPNLDFFREGINRAQSAVVIGQTAQSPQDWQLAATRWQQAITYLQQVPATDPNHPAAQERLQTYQENLAQAQGRAQGEGFQPLPPPTNVPAANANGRVARIPIVERRGGTPVVSVALITPSGRQQFPMLFDTGATGTLITPEMAQAMGVEIVDQVTVIVADGRRVRMPIGMVDIEVGGLVRRNVLVAIGGSVGLLGQDVYGAYGISAGRDVIELFE